MNVWSMLLYTLQYPPLYSLLCKVGTGSFGKPLLNTTWRCDRREKRTEEIESESEDYRRLSQQSAF